MKSETQTSNQSSSRKFVLIDMALMASAVVRLPILSVLSWLSKICSVYGSYPKL